MTYSHGPKCEQDLDHRAQLCKKTILKFKI